MFVTEMLEDATKCVMPSWDQIENAIRKLNGLTHTLVTLSAGEEVPHLAIGDGKDGLYILYITYDNSRFFNLYNSTANKDKQVEMVVGGQIASYDREMCIGLDASLKATRVFAERGELDRESTWKES